MSSEYAATILIHYIRRAHEAAGLKWDGENSAEIEEAVGLIVNAAAQEAGAMLAGEDG